jgi:hypothetical protein
MKRKHFKPARQLIFIILFAIMAFSCGKHKNCVSKLTFIIINKTTLVQNKDHYHLLFNSYIEYRPDSIIKIAKGKLINNLTDSAKCIYQYYSYSPKEQLKKFIDSLLCDQKYDSTYLHDKKFDTISNNPNFGAKCIFIYTLSNGEKTIFADTKLLPRNLKLLSKRLSKIYSAKNQVLTNEFKFDTTGKKLDQRLYKISPPSPPPLELELVKFTKPKN